MSINQLFEISRSSFRTLDAAMNTLGQNIANANTEGYVRRRLVMRSNSISTRGLHSQQTGTVATGAGLSVQSYERLRDQLLLKTGYEANTSMGSAEEEHRVIAALEGLFPAQGDGTLVEQLNAFWNAWSDLADNPADNGVRQALRARAKGLTGTLNVLDGRISDLESQTTQALSTGVDQINKKLKRLAELNTSIVTANRAGSPDFSAEDERDRIMADLSKMAPVRVHEGDDGLMNVSMDGIMVVQDDHYEQLELNTDGATPQVLFKDLGVEWNAPSEGGGRLGGWLRSLTTALPETRASLDALAAALVEQVNTAHQAGINPNGNTGVDFFDAGGTTAGTISLDSGILNDVKEIAASAGDPTAGVNDSDVANNIFALRDALFMNGNTEDSETFVINMVAGLGAQVEQARTTYESQAAFADHLQAMEKGVSGVSMDEEMTKMIEYQQAFQASARVLTTAQNMFDTLLAI